MLCVLALVSRCHKPADLQRCGGIDLDGIDAGAEVGGPSKGDGLAGTHSQLVQQFQGGVCRASNAIGAHVEGNATHPEHGYLYIVHGESWDEQDDGTESNSTLVIAGYAYYDNDTDGQKDWEAVKIVVSDWDDDDENGEKDEGETDYTTFGAEVHRD